MFLLENIKSTNFQFKKRSKLLLWLNAAQKQKPKVKCSSQSYEEFVFVFVGNAFNLLCWLPTTCSITNSIKGVSEQNKQVH